MSFKPTAYVSLIYRVISIILKPLDILLSYLDNLLIGNITKLEEPKLIFIIGIHRSGATLFGQKFSMQSFCDNLSNFQLIFKRTAFISYLLKINIKRNFFRNFYGQTFRLSDISDLNEFWNYHLKIKDSEFISSKIKINNSLKFYLKKYYSYTKKPIVIKNGRNIFIIKKLYNQFPKSFFIFIDRKNKDINKSISKSKSVFFNYDWGLKIKNDKKFINYSVSKKNILLKNVISKQITLLNKKRYIKIRFEDFKKNNFKVNRKKILKINEFFAEK